MLMKKEFIANGKAKSKTNGVITRWSLRVALCLLCLFLAGGVTRAETIDRIVAVVNDDIILYSELQDQVKLLQEASPSIKLNTQAEREQFERGVLQRMIQTRLAEQEIKRLKINVSEHDIDAAVDRFKQENGFTDDQLKYVLQQQGETLARFREDIKKQLERARLIERVLKSKTVITDEQVDSYLQGQEGSAQPTVSTNEKRHLAVIFLPVRSASQADQVEQLANKIHKQLKDGEDFSKLAKQYSQGPAAEDGGDIGFIAATDLAPAIASATQGLNANQITDVLKTPQGCYIIKVVEVRGEQQKVSNNSTTARDKARNVLFQQEIDRKYEQWIKELMDKSFIQVNL